MRHMLALILCAILSICLPATATADTNDSVVLLQGLETDHTPSLGAGAVIGQRADTLTILTAAHVAKLASLSVTMHDGRVAQVQRVRIDIDSDSAIVTAELPVESSSLESMVVYPQLHIAGTKPLPGERLTVIGHPLGRLWTVSSATVADLVYGADPGDFTFFCDTCNLGDSGGPVLNQRGEIVGIVSGWFTMKNRRYEVSSQRENFEPLISANR